MKYIKHLIAEMDESMVQHCLLCSEVISDYRNAISPDKDFVPTGWEAGEIFVSVSKNPQHFTKSISPEDSVINCMNPLREVL